MDNNYTPIDTKKLEHKDNGLNTILLVIVTLTALVLAIMLFVLIQKKISSTNNIEPTIIPTSIVTPSQATAEPEQIEVEEQISPTASAAPILEASPVPEENEASEASSIN